MVGPGGDELPRGEPGEIVVRGYNVMDGYLDDPEATAAAVDADGWLHTGDVGTMDAAGYVAITDRLKDMFICGGFNAYPAEIEATMLAHPAVGQVAVVGRPDDRLGEVGHAFVVPAPGAATGESAGDELVAWCRQRMANYKAPAASPSPTSCRSTLQARCSSTSCVHCWRATAAPDGSMPLGRDRRTSPGRTPCGCARRTPRGRPLREPAPRRD